MYDQYEKQRMALATHPNKQIKDELLELLFCEESKLLWCGFLAGTVGNAGWKNSEVMILAASRVHQELEVMIVCSVLFGGTVSNTCQSIILWCV